MNLKEALENFLTNLHAEKAGPINRCRINIKKYIFGILIKRLEKEPALIEKLHHNVSTWKIVYHEIMDYIARNKKASNDYNTLFQHYKMAILTSGGCLNPTEDRWQRALALAKTIQLDLACDIESLLLNSEPKPKTKKNTKQVQWADDDNLCKIHFFNSDNERSSPCQKTQEMVFSCFSFSTSFLPNFYFYKNKIQAWFSSPRSENTPVDDNDDNRSFPY